MVMCFHFVFNLQMLMSVQKIHRHVGVIQDALTHLAATTVSANTDSVTVQKMLTSHRDSA